MRGRVRFCCPTVSHQHVKYEEKLVSSATWKERMGPGRANEDRRLAAPCSPHEDTWFHATPLLSPKGYEHERDEDRLPITQ